MMVNMAALFNGNRGLMGTPFNARAAGVMPPARGPRGFWAGVGVGLPPLAAPLPGLQTRGGALTSSGCSGRVAGITPPMAVRFELLSTDPTGARAGVLHTRRGSFPTPMFMPVATHAA